MIIRPGTYVSPTSAPVFVEDVTQRGKKFIVTYRIPWHTPEENIRLSKPRFEKFLKFAGLVHVSAECLPIDVIEEHQIKLRILDPKP